MEELLEKTRAYLAYVQEHYDNVQKAWAEMQDTCSDLWFVVDPLVQAILDQQVLDHDKSKLSKQEFTAYRRKFFPTKEEMALSPHTIEVDFQRAWGQHYDHNHHHWQKWSTFFDSMASEKRIACVHMVINWVAMSYKFNNPKRKYYDDHKGEIDIPEMYHHLIESIFDCMGG